MTELQVSITCFVFHNHIVPLPIYRPSHLAFSICTSSHLISSNQSESYKKGSNQPPLGCYDLGKCVTYVLKSITLVLRMFIRSFLLLRILHPTLLYTILHYTKTTLHYSTQLYLLTRVPHSTTSNHFLLSRSSSHRPRSGPYHSSSNSNIILYLYMPKPTHLILSTGRQACR